MRFAWRIKSPTATGVRFSRKPEARQRHSGDTDAEFFQRCAARDGLGEDLSEFIELVVHKISFILHFVLLSQPGWNGESSLLRRPVRVAMIRNEVHEDECPGGFFGVRHWRTLAANHPLK